MMRLRRTVFSRNWQAVGFVVKAVVLVSIFSWSGTQVSGQDPRTVEAMPVDGNEYAASLLQSLLLNNRALLSYDVSYQRETFSMNSDHAIRSLKSRHRVLVDGETGAKVVICGLQIDGWKDSEIREVTKRVYGILVTPDHRVFYRNINGLREVGGDSSRLPAKLVSCPTFTTIGLETFPDTRTVDASDNLFWDRVVLGRRGLSVSSAHSNEVTVSLDIDNPTGDDVGYKWVFDQTKMIPRRCTVSILTNGKSLPKSRDVIEWEEFSDAYVPSRIRRSIVPSHGGSDEQSSHGMEATDDTDFQWRELDSEMSDFAFTLDEFMEIDPENFLKISKVE